MDLTGFGTVNIIKEIFYYILPQKKEREEKQKIEEEKKIKEEEKKFKEEEKKFKEEELKKQQTLREEQIQNIYNIGKPLLLREFSDKDVKPEYSKDDIRKYFSQ